MGGGGKLGGGVSAFWSRKHVEKVRDGGAVGGGSGREVYVA